MYDVEEEYNDDFNEAMEEQRANQSFEEKCKRLLQRNSIVNIMIISGISFVIGGIAFYYSGYGNDPDIGVCDKYENDKFIMQARELLMEKKERIRINVKGLSDAESLALQQKTMRDQISKAEKRQPRDEQLLRYLQTLQKTKPNKEVLDAAENKARLVIDVDVELRTLSSKINQKNKQLREMYSDAIQQKLSKQEEAYEHALLDSVLKLEKQKLTLSSTGKYQDGWIMEQSKSRALPSFAEREITKYSEHNAENIAHLEQSKAKKLIKLKEFEKEKGTAGIELETLGELRMNERFVHLELKFIKLYVEKAQYKPLNFLAGDIMTKSFLRLSKKKAKEIEESIKKIKKQITNLREEFAELDISISRSENIAFISRYESEKGLAKQWSEEYQRLKESHDDSRASIKKLQDFFDEFFNGYWKEPMRKHDRMMYEHIRQLLNDDKELEEQRLSESVSSLGSWGEWPGPHENVLKFQSQKEQANQWMTEYQMQLGRKKGKAERQRERILHENLEKLFGEFFDGDEFWKEYIRTDNPEMYEYLKGLFDPEKTEKGT